MTAHDPAKRVPKSIGTDAKLLGRFTLTDIAVGLFPGVIVLLATQVLLPPTLLVGAIPLQTIALPATAAAIGLGVLFVYLTPDYTTSLTWLTTLLRYRRRPTRLPHEAARTTTHVQRVHPGDEAVERTDGALFGLVQVEPPAMALATDAEWASKAEAFEGFLNTVIEFPIQLFSTTQRFPIEDYLARYEARLHEADVKANPRLATLIQRYVEWYAEELDSRRMTIREHYVVVPVTPAEVRFEREGMTRQLAAIPWVGSLIDLWLGPRSDEVHVAMVDALDERLRRVEAGLRDIDGCTARRIGVDEAVQLLAEFWNGESREYGDMRRMLRTHPVVGGTP